MVFAASDLGPAFKQIVPQFERKTGSDVTLVLGSTGMLAQQIRNGAPADVFFAANESFVNGARRRKPDPSPDATSCMRAAASRRSRSSRAASASTASRISTDPRVKRIAIANPQHAPYGLAARQALEAAGLWKTLEPKLVFGENVQQAVQFVRSGSAEAGLVARSVADTPDLHVDARGRRAPRARSTRWPSSLARTKQPAASMSFIEFVNGTQGRLVMRQFGFLLPDESLLTWICFPSGSRFAWRCWRRC